jgi:hypothetical protein
MKSGYCHKNIHERVQGFTALKPKKPQKTGLRKKWVVKQELKLENGKQLTLKSNLLIQNESHSNPIA